MYFYITNEKIVANPSIGTLARIILRDKGIDYTNVNDVINLAYESLGKDEFLSNLSRAFKFIGANNFSSAVDEYYS